METMTLLNLKGENVGPLPAFEIDLSLPVTYIAGRNETGKSHIARHALQFVLTERIRGFKHYQDSEKMRRNFAPMSVELTCRQNGEDKVLKRSLPKRTADWAERIDTDVMRIALNPMWFLRLTTKERGRILAELVRPNETARIIGDLLHTSEIDEDKAQAHTAIMNGIYEATFDRADVDAWEAAVIAIRKVSKRELEPLKDKNKPELKDDVIDKQETAATLEQQYRTESENLGRLKQQQSQWQQRQKLQKEIKEAKKIIAKNEGLLKPEAEKQFAEAEKKLATLQEQQKLWDAKKKIVLQIEGLEEEIKKGEALIHEIPEDLTALRAEISAIKRQLDLYETAKDAKTCPICDNEVDPEHIKNKADKLARVLKDRITTFNTYEQEEENNQGIITAMEVKKQFITGLQGQVTKDMELVLEPKGIAELEATITQLRADAAAHATAKNHITIKEAEIKAWQQSMADAQEPDEEEIKRLSDLIRANEAELQKHRAFEQEIAVYEAGQKRRRELEAIIFEANRMAELLTAGGDIRAHLVNAGEEIPYHKKLVEAWGLHGFNMDDTGQIQVDNRDISIASDSKRFRVAAVVAMALAQLADIGFCVLDGIDILDRENQTALLTAIEVTNLNNVILACTDSKELKTEGQEWPDWLRIYQTRTDNGAAVVEQVH